MRPYSKINNIFKTEKISNVEKRYKKGHYKNKYFEFLNLIPWSCTEKVDGINMRVIVTEDSVKIWGRNDGSEVRADLREAICDLFDFDQVQKIIKEREWESVTFYGEGYGMGIQNGGDYCKNKSFILFDVLINNNIWMQRLTMISFANELDISVVPELASCGLMDAYMRLKLGDIKSKLKAEVKSFEGIVCKPIFILFDKNGKRIVCKIKNEFIGK